MRDWQKGKLWLCLDQYLEKLVLIYYLKYLKLLATLLSGQELTLYKGEATPNQTKGYQRHIGSITYPASTTRPDIAFLVSRLAEFLYCLFGLTLCLNQYLKKLVSIYYLEYLKLLATPLSGQELTLYKGEATLNQIKGY